VSDLVREYVRSFVAKDLNAITAMLDPDIRFWDPNLGPVHGAQAVTKAYAEIFASTPTLRCDVVQVLADDPWTVFEFRLEIGQEVLRGTDLIRWTSEGRIAELRAYVNPDKA
jgi:ketosteroid isomerase-like protein